MGIVPGQEWLSGDFFVGNDAYTRGTGGKTCGEAVGVYGTVFICGA